MKKIQQQSERVRAEFFYSESKETQGKTGTRCFLYVKENHLGNVLVTVSDARQVLNSGSTVTGYMAIVKSANDYSSFGAPKAGRTYTSAGYRYGFNGKENDPETSTQDYGMRIYDPRLGRFLSVDPLFKKFAMLTPYQFASNMPIAAVDLDGEEATIVIHSAWFKGQIDAALEAGDYAEAERLTWCAVAATMDNGNPAATFQPDPNGLTGFAVFYQPADGSAQIAVFATMTGIKYEAALEPWAKGSPNPMIARTAEIDAELAKIDQELQGINAELSELANDDDSIIEASERVTQSQQDGIPPFDDGGGGAAGVALGALVWTVDANMKVEDVHQTEGQLNARKGELIARRDELQKSRDVVTAEPAPDKYVMPEQQPYIQHVNDGEVEVEHR